MWAVFALFAGMANSVALEINKHYKIDGLTFSFWRSFLSAVMLLPLIAFMEWPENPTYYLVILLTGVISVVGTMVQFNLAAKHNGRVANLAQPITILISFIIWLAIDEAERTKFSSDLFYASSVLLALTIMVVSLQFMRRNDASWTIFLAILPVGCLYAIINVMSKLMLDDNQNALAIAVNFVFLANICMAATSLPVLISLKLQKKKAHIMPKYVLTAAGASGLFNTISWISINLALISATNPSYPFVISALSPIWFALYYKMRNIHDDLSPYAGLALSFAAILLLISTL